MHVSHVALDDYRSYRHLVTELAPGVSVLVGSNGQGKTNLVEAISYLSSFSSHRVAADAALVRAPMEGESEPLGAVIRVKLVTHAPPQQNGVPDQSPEDVSPPRQEKVLELEIVRGKANRARINRANVAPKEILGMVRTVVFAPEDLQLVKGDPSARRLFLDDLATQLHPVLQAERADFSRVARQRVALLKSMQSQLGSGRGIDESALEVWNERFARLSATLTAARQKLLDQLTGPATAAYSHLSGSDRRFDMKLEASSHHRQPGGDLTDIDANTRDIYQQLTHHYHEEIRRGANLVGAHRDDLSLSLGGLKVKGYASHGESWSVALALKLGAFDVLKSDEDTPILILDDVFAELDTRRRQALTTIIDSADQVFITSAVPEDLPEELRHKNTTFLHVSFDREHGSVVADG